MISAQDLLENHHAFMALHRGTVSRLDGAVRWDSDEAYFRCLLLESRPGLAAIGHDTLAVRTFPWSADLAPDLERLGFGPTGVLRYMVSAPRTAEVPTPPDFTITLATDVAGMERFSDVQSRGFQDPGEELEPLYTFLHGANVRNVGHPAQRFYVAHVGGEPVAVTLLLTQASTCGIYAVATLPEHRRRGYSRILLSRAMNDAERAGASVVTLQVFRDSDAERVYTRLGFTVEFDCQLWARGSAAPPA
jgi:GNAT superfamily N-acetyltransferase